MGRFGWSAWVLTFALVTGTVPTAAAEEQPAFIEVSSGALTFLLPAGDEGKVATVRELVGQLDARRQLLEGFLELPMPAVTPQTFWIFPDEATGQRFGALADTAQRLRAPEEVVILAVGDPAPQQERFLRAAVELLLEERLELMPVFLRAGFLHFLIDSEITADGRVRPLATAERMAELRKQDWYSLGQFGEDNPGRFKPEVLRGLGGQMWASVFYLGGNDSQRARFLELCRRVLDGASFSMAFAEVFETYYDNVQIEVRSAAKRRGNKAFEKNTLSFAYRRPEIQQRPLSPGELSARQGLLLLELGRIAEAEALCREALARNPGEAWAHYCEGRIFARKTHLEAARQSFDRALKAAPGHALAAFEAGKLLLLPAPDDPKADPAAALPLLRKAVELRPHLGAAWSALALAAIHSRPRPADAVELAEEANRRVPARTDVGLALYRLYGEEGRTDEAEKLAKSSVQLRRKLPGYRDSSRRGVVGNDPLAMFAEANRLMAEKKFEAALALLETLRSEGDNPSLAESLDPKIAELRRVVRHNAFVLRHAEAVEHYNAQRYDEAIALLEAMLPTLEDAEDRGKTEALLVKAKDIEAARQKVAIHNEFAAVYREAVELYNARKLQEAITKLEAIKPTLLEPADIALADTFLERCRKAIKGRNPG